MNRIVVNGKAGPLYERWGGLKLVPRKPYSIRSVHVGRMSRYAMVNKVLRSTGLATSIRTCCSARMVNTLPTTRK